MKKLLIMVIFLSITIINIQSYTYEIGIKYVGVRSHPVGDINAHLFPRKFSFDTKGIFVLNNGIMASFGKNVWKDFLSIKLMQAAYADCALVTAGFSHLGFRLKVFSLGKHEINGGIGPTFVYRQNWYRFEEYDDNPARNFYGGGPEDDWQWRFIWYGGDIEYNYNLHNNIDLSVNVIPGIPYLIAVACGIRIKF
jgi:hypothetical protein